MFRKWLSSQNIRQFASYFSVGGVSALVEWVCFYLLDAVLNVPYLLATALAFIVSTTTNWFLGRTFTFKDSVYKNKKLRELIMVFIASAIGLVFNLLLMTLFVEVIGMKTGILKTVAKVISTGIVFVWNFFSRKIWIYRET